MFKGKIFEYLKKYFDQYLFGFDKRQLDVALLSGNVDVKNVNLRPDKANEFITRTPLPFAIKAGMLGKLSLKFSLISTLSKPLEVTVDDFCLILGPRQHQISHNESYHEVGSQDDTDDEYDDENAFNIFEHQLQVRLMDRQKKRKLKRKKRPENEDDKLSNEDKIWKNLKLTLNRIHIRYEDDYFAGNNPYSFGLIAENISMMTTGTIWKFPNLESIKFKRETPQVLRGTNLIIKELIVKSLKIYWNSQSEMFIPISLWEQTKHLEYQIFDAMPADVLYELMMDFFNPEEKRVHQQDIFIEPFDSYMSFQQWDFEKKNEKSLKINALCRPLVINVRPAVLRDIGHFQWYLQNLGLIPHLKIYRPYRRPIVLRPGQEQEEKKSRHDNQKSQISQAFKRKRRLIVRDWFFLVVWYVRIRRGFKKFSSKIQDRGRLLQKCENRVSAILNNKEFCLKTPRFDLEIVNWLNQFINFTRAALTEATKDEESELTSSERDLLNKSRKNQTEDVIYFLEPKLGVQYIFKVEKLVLKIFDGKQKLHKAALKVEGVAADIDVLENQARIKSMARSVKTFLVMSNSIPFHARSNATHFNTPAGSKSSVFETPSTQRMPPVPQVQPKTKSNTFNRFYEGTRNFISNKFSSNKPASHQFDVQMPPSRSGMSKANSPKKGFLSAGGNPLASEVMFPPRANPVTAKNLNTSTSFFQPSYDNLTTKSQYGKVDIFSGPSKRPSSGLHHPGNLQQSFAFSPDHSPITARPLAGVSNFMHSSSANLFDQLTERIPDTRAGTMVQKCFFVLEPENTSWGNAAFFYSNSTAISNQAIGLQADMHLGTVRIEYSPEYLKAVLQLLLQYEVVLPLTEDIVTASQRVSSFSAAKKPPTHILTPSILKQFCSIPLVLLSRIFLPQKLANSSPKKKRRILSRDNDGTAVIVGNKESSEDESEASVGNEGGISDKFSGFMRSNTKKFKFASKPINTSFRHYKANPQPHGYMDFEADDEVGEETISKPPAGTFISATSHPHQGEPNYEIQLPAVGQTTRRNHYIFKNNEVSKDLLANQKLELAVKNFDELMALLNMKVNFSLKGLIIQDKQQRAFALTLPQIPLKIEKTKEASLVGAMGMELCFSNSLGLNMSQMKIFKNHLDFYLHHPIVNQIQLNFRERKRVTSQLYRVQRRGLLREERKQSPPVRPDFEIESVKGASLIDTQQGYGSEFPEYVKHAARKVGGGNQEEEDDEDEIVIQGEDWGLRQHNSAEIETPREMMDELRNRQRFNFESIMAQKSQQTDRKPLF